MWICSCVCTHMCIGWTQISEHVEAKGHWCLLWSLSTFLRLCPENQANSCICIPSIGVTGTLHSIPLFVWVLGIGTQVLMLVTSIPLHTEPLSQFCSCLLNSHLKYMSRTREKAQRWRMVAEQVQGLEFNLMWEAEHGQHPYKPSTVAGRDEGSQGF